MDQLEVTAKLMCLFVFPYAKSRFSHNMALIRKKKGTLSFFVYAQKYCQPLELKIEPWREKTNMLDSDQVGCTATGDG